MRGEGDAHRITRPLNHGQHAAGEPSGVEALRQLLGDQGHLAGGLPDRGVARQEDRQKRLHRAVDGVRVGGDDPDDAEGAVAQHAGTAGVGLVGDEPLGGVDEQIHRADGGDDLQGRFPQGLAHLAAGHACEVSATGRQEFPELARDGDAFRQRSQAPGR
ncbi:MAG: hypothetical protein ABGY42_17480, partial [bacterium]